MREAPTPARPRQPPLLLLTFDAGCDRLRHRRPLCGTDAAGRDFTHCSGARSRVCPHPAGGRGACTHTHPHEPRTEQGTSGTARG